MRKVFTAAVPLALLLLLAALRIADLRATREDALRAAEARARNLADITSAYLTESVASADAVLRQLVVHSRRVGGPQAPSSEWLPILAAARAGVALGALTITDDAGIIRHSTLSAIIGQSRASEPSFADAVRLSGDTLLAGAPFPVVQPMPDAPRYIIPLTRRLTDANGRFVGTATASFLPGVAQPFLKSVDVGGGGAIRVLHPNGAVLFEEGQADANAAASKVTATHTSTTPPLIVEVSLDERAVLATWRSEATRSGVLFGLVAAVLVVVLLFLLREMAARTESLAREQRARVEAEQANAVKDQFLMTLSHELRTPLTAIRGWARILSLDAVDVTRRGKAVQAIERNAQAQERLIDDLLDVSRVMGGKLPLNVKPVAIADVAQQALETVRPAAEAKNLNLQSAIDLSAGTVSGDHERLQQVIWNLLSNAVKFTPAGGRVLLEVRRSGNAALVVVSDTGVGISPRFLPHVFERFRQEDASTTREHGGLGLGLAIVRSLVEMHGGTVRAHSDGTGRGATFTVTLPLLAAPAAARENLRPALS